MANRSAVLQTEESSQRDTASHPHEPCMRTTAQYGGSTKKHVPVIDIESFPKENPKPNIPTQDARFSSDTQPSSRFSSDTQPSSRFSNNSQKKNERAQKNSFNLASKKQSTHSDHIPVFHRSPKKDLPNNKRSSSKGNSKNTTKCMSFSQVASKSKFPPKVHAASGKTTLAIKDVGGTSARNTKRHNIVENRLIKNQSVIPEPSYSDSETDELNNNATEFQSDIDIIGTATVDGKDIVEAVDIVTPETETDPAADQLPIDSEIKTSAPSENPFVAIDDIESSSNCMDSPACVEQKAVNVTANGTDSNDNIMSSFASSTQEADVSNASTYGNESPGNSTNLIASVTHKTMRKQQSIEAEILGDSNQSSILKAPKAVNTKPVTTRASSKNRKSVPKQTEYDSKQLYGRFNVRDVRVHYNNKGERIGSGTMVVVETYTERVKNWVPDRDWRALRMMPLRTRDMNRHSEAVVKIYLDFQSHSLWTDEKIEEKLREEFHATDFKLVYDINGQCMKVAIILLTYANAETLNKVLRCNEVFDPKLRIRMLEVVDKPIESANGE